MKRKYADMYYSVKKTDKGFIWSIYFNYRDKKAAQTSLENDDDDDRYLENETGARNDVIIVLGAATKEAFPPIPCTTIYIAHPASKRSHEEMNDYVEKTLQLINHE